MTGLCRRLGVSRASYYRWRHRQDRPPSARVQRQQTITQQIQLIFTECHGRVGRRPMRKLLHQRGITCSAGLVHRIMATNRLQAIRHRAWRCTTRRNPAASTAHLINHLQTPDGHRSFASPAPGLRTVGDITYIRTADGWLYLAVVIDLANRAVIGWAIRTHLGTDLVMSALTMAHTQHALRPGVIFHSDHGSQYTSTAFQSFCTRHQITQSLGTTGVCWDNAVAESFFATLKGDRRGLPAFPTRTAARHWLISYIEDWYNRRRPHSSNANLPPLRSQPKAIPPPRPVSPS